MRGRGIVWLPELYLRQYLNDGRLVEILPTYRTDPMPVWCVYPARRHTAAKVRLFIEFLKQRLPYCDLAQTPRLKIVETTEASVGALRRTP